MYAYGSIHQLVYSLFMYSILIFRVVETNDYTHLSVCKTVARNITQEHVPRNVFDDLNHVRVN